MYRRLVVEIDGDGVEPWVFRDDLKGRSSAFRIALNREGFLGCTGRVVCRDINFPGDEIVGHGGPRVGQARYRGFGIVPVGVVCGCVGEPQRG